MRKLLAVFLLALLLPTMALGEVWGSAKSKVYHNRLCRFKAKIRQEYRVSFASPAQARKAGYQPCGICRPPGIEPPESRKSQQRS